MQKIFSLTPFSITLIYLSFASLWIFGSGYLVIMHTQNPMLIHRIDLIKGMIFVITTSIILYGLVRKLHDRLTHTSLQLQATLDAIPDLMFEVDIDGRYHYIHYSKEDLLAAPPEKLYGKTIRDILPPHVAEVCYSALTEADEKGFSFGKQFDLPLKEGIKWFELSVSRKPTIVSGKHHFIVLSRDITERKHNEEKIIHLSQLYAALSQCNQAIARAQNEEELFPLICKDAVL